MTLETPSGKSAATENFPVGSWLLRAELRPPIHAFYRFARAADDIADNPALPAGEKLRRLDRMGAALAGGDAPDAPAAAAMHGALQTGGHPSRHCDELLDAFRQDAVKLRYASWDELLGYCRLSAVPVGRQVLDLHAQPELTWAFSDPLCSALQILNHLQDCVEDWRLLDRVYLPLDLLAAEGAAIQDLGQPASPPALRRVIDAVLERTAELCRAASGLPAAVTDRRLRCETAMIVTLAWRMIGQLRRDDPLARPVKPRKRDFAVALASGLVQGLRPRMAA